MLLMSSRGDGLFSPEKWKRENPLEEISIWNFQTILKSVGLAEGINDLWSDTSIGQPFTPLKRVSYGQAY